jgi:hypothetical protein
MSGLLAGSCSSTGRPQDADATRAWPDATHPFAPGANASA